jgi:ornithine cyclodeaminase/alanine dehydrogenase-like protein (mu-crystallin family)
MSSSGPPALRYLSANEVKAAMPPLDERLELAERTMVALVADAELPPKIGVHPRPDDSFGHAMPAYLRGADPEGRNDLVGMKWIAGFPGNGARGLPALHGLVLVVDPMTGVPTAILDAGPITAERTAAVSGVAISRFAPPLEGRSPLVALIGAGLQGRSHLAVIGRVLPGARLAIFDRHAERARALAEAARATEGISDAHTSETAQHAVASADVVVTAAAFGPIRQVMTSAWLSPNALVVPVDYATYCAAEVPRDAALFLVDQREQFIANRDAGLFDGYPDPTATIGEAIVGRMARPPVGRVVVSHLGVGLADLVFADAILRRAMDAGLGTLLVGSGDGPPRGPAD